MEIWELTDKFGEGAGVYYDRSSGEPIPEGYFFRVAEVWVKLGGQLLLTRRHPEKWAGLCWEVPGGGVLRDEDPICAASRELFEETGIAVSPGELTFLGRSAHQNALVYSYLAELNTAPVLNLQPSEVVDCKFVTPEEAEEMRGEMTVGTASRLENVKSLF